MPSDGTRPGFARRVRAAMSEHLALKAAALFFACVLWLVVTAEEPTEQVVYVIVSPRLDSSLTVDGPRPTVRALVVGRARELLKLASEPPVVRPLVEGAVKDSVLLAVRAGDVELPADAQVLVRDVRPREVMLHVRRVSRPVPLPTAAESALAGLTPVRGTLLTDTLAAADSIGARTDSALADSARRDSLRRDSVRRDSARADSLRARGRRPRRS